MSQKKISISIFFWFCKLTTSIIKLFREYFILRYDKSWYSSSRNKVFDKTIKIYKMHYIFTWQFKSIGMNGGFEYLKNTWSILKVAYKITQ